MAKPKTTAFVPTATRQAALEEARKTAAAARQKADKALRAAMLKESAEARADEDHKKYIFGGWMIANCRLSAARGGEMLEKAKNNIRTIAGTLDEKNKAWFLAAMNEELTAIENGRVANSGAGANSQQPTP